MDTDACDWNAPQISYSTPIFIESILTGNLATMKIMATMPDFDISYNINHALILAAEYGQLEVLDYLIIHFNNGIIASVTLNNAIGNAVRNGHINIVKYLVQVFHKMDEKYIGFNILDHFAVAARHGHVKIMQYFDSLAGFNIYLDKFGENIFLNAAGYNHVNVLQYLVPLLTNGVPIIGLRCAFHIAV